MCSLLKLIAFALIFGLFTSSALYGQSRQQTPATAFTGAGACASSNCHGSVWPRSGGNIDQNEYFIWSSKDQHAKAYNVLLEPRSRQIARNMRIERAETASLCLSCHTTNVPVSQRAASFEASDGVGCESCHGPASGWLGLHTTRDWKHAQSVALGMTDTRDIRRRAEVCLSCHLGNEEKSVDHELIAAGHPDLIFELDTFSALMPVHWKSKADLEGVRRLLIGQAVALRESMKQLVRRTKAEAGTGWPDFADFECSSCHHNLVVPSARQERGYIGRAGVPPWNESRYVVFRLAVGTILAAQQKPLDDLIARLKGQLEKGPGARLQVAETAASVAVLVDELIPQLEKAPLDRQVISRLLRSISGASENIARAGIRSAEQATMAVDALYHAGTSDSGKADDAFNAQIDLLYDALQSMPRYDPDGFASSLKRIPSF
jgi:hypothetical protein